MKNDRLRIATSPSTPFLIDRMDFSQVELIIMGTQGRSGLARAFLGRVAARVGRYAATPVLAVPEPQHGAAPSLASSSVVSWRRVCPEIPCYGRHTWSRQRCQPDSILYKDQATPGDNIAVRNALPWQMRAYLAGLAGSILGALVFIFFFASR